MLADIQSQLIQSLLDSENHSDALELILPGNRSCSTLDIYKNSIQVSLLKSLSATYPVCEKLVGEDFFCNMAQEYIKNNPSRNPDLTFYGETYSYFIEEFLMLHDIKGLEYLSDVARLEWAWYQVFNAPDEQKSERDDRSLIEQLSTLAEPDILDILFQVSPHSILLESLHPVLQIWEANMEDYSDSQIIDYHEGQNYLLVHRQQLNMRIDILDEIQFLFLRLVSRKHTIGEIHDQLQERFGNYLLDHILIDACNNGWITRFVTNNISHQ